MDKESLRLSGQDLETDFLQTARIFIIDDSAVGRHVLDEIVRSISPQISVLSFSSPVTALEAVRSHPPDLVLVDFRMPEMTGAEFTRKFRTIPDCEAIPLVIVTIFDERDVRYESLEAGATDFLMRPLDPFEVRVRCTNLLALQRNSRIIRSRAIWLQEEVDKATLKILEREKESLLILAKVGEYHDKSTSAHVLRMAKYSRLIGEFLELSSEFVQSLELAAPMHDIGKIGIPDRILLKSGSLTTEEYEIMKTHPAIGYEILRHSSSEVLRLGGDIALGHQERFDGSGYPGGLRGTDIPLASRIVAVADVFDALNSPRPYKPAWPFDKAYEYILSNSGTLFDPDCVRAFQACINDIWTLSEWIKDEDE